MNFQSTSANLRRKKAYYGRKALLGLSVGSLMFDRVTSISGDRNVEHGKGYVRAELHIRRDSRLILEGTKFSLLDGLEQLLTFYLWWLGVPGKANLLCFSVESSEETIPPTARLVEYGLDVHRVTHHQDTPFGHADGWIKCGGTQLIKAGTLRASVSE